MMGAIAQPAGLLSCKCLLHVVLSKPSLATPQQGVAPLLQISAAREYTDEAGTIAGLKQRRADGSEGSYSAGSSSTSTGAGRHPRTRNALTREVDEATSSANPKTAIHVVET